HLAVDALDDADQVRAILGLAGERHEVDDAHDAAVAYEIGLEDHRVAAVALLVLTRPDRGPDGEGPVLVVADEGREAGVGVEAWWTPPVDRSGARHQSRGARVADEPVVLDARCHGENSKGTLAGRGREIGGRGEIRARLTAPRGRSHLREREVER